jgi:calcineurin-like phosphoesterase
MKILFIGDVVARSGREALINHLPNLKTKLSPDVVIVNGENAAHGIGINEKICVEMFDHWC